MEGTVGGTASIFHGKVEGLNLISAFWLLFFVVFHFHFLERYVCLYASKHKIHMIIHAKYLLLDF